MTQRLDLLVVTPFPDHTQQKAEQTQRNAISRLLAMSLSAEQVANALGVSLDEIEHDAIEPE